MTLPLAAPFAQPAMASHGVRVLHVPYTYFPDACGGTEIYVHSLARQLAGLGYACAVAAPGTEAAEYHHEAVPVFRFPVDANAGIEQAYGVPDATAAAGFRSIVARFRPAIVHFHARTSAVSEELFAIARAAGARVVLTYHSPTVSCLRGDMMLYGRTPCDGRVEQRRCTSCALQSMQVPPSIAAAAASLPEPVLLATARLAALSGRLSALRIPQLILEWQRRLIQLLSQVDHVVAVCEWVHDVLLRNGVPQNKLSLSRQGIVYGRATAAPRRERAGAPLRVAYFGRASREKGVDILVSALADLPAVDVTLDCYVIRQAAADAGFDALTELARRDPRVRIRAAVRPGDVHDAMRAYDLIAVPSRCLETGPLVVLDAHAAGVPVLGTGIGGIAELVRDGIDGILVAGTEPAGWARAIAAIAADRSLLDRLTGAIRPPRSVLDVAQDTAAIYSALVAPTAGLRSHGSFA